jgi:hypothetical protein
MTYGRAGAATPSESEAVSVAIALSAEAPTAPKRIREQLWSIASPLALAACVLMLGLWQPPPLQNLLRAAAQAVGVRP